MIIKNIVLLEWLQQGLSSNPYVAYLVAALGMGLILFGVLKNENRLLEEETGIKDTGFSWVTLSRTPGIPGVILFCLLAMIACVALFVFHIL